MKVLHAVVGAVVLARVPNVDLSTGYIGITPTILLISVTLASVVDRDIRNVVDTHQVNSPPGVLQDFCVSTLCCILIHCSFRRVLDIAICVV